MGAEGGTSLLETPPYVIAVVFQFFLVVTLGFEWILHRILHALKKRNKHGLVAAMNNMTNEIMLLGVATLILSAIERDTARICIPSKAYAGMTWLDRVEGCACCLSNTANVSPCYLQAKGCQSADTLEGCCNDNYDLNSAEGQVCGAIFGLGDSLQNAGERRRLLSAPAAGATPPGGEAEAICDGRIQVGWEECGFSEHKRPAIGSDALHQVHLFIFYMAITHILGGILLIVLASWRMRFWRRWTEQADPISQEARRAVDGNIKEIEMAATGKSKAGSSMTAEAGGAKPAEGAVPKEAAKPVPAAHRSEPDLAALERGPPADVDCLDIARKSKWRGRPAHVRGLGHCWEMMWCLLRQFNFVCVVHKDEFSLMRASFYFTHHIDSGAKFDFISYVRDSMEDDYGKLVGLGLPMWLFLIFFVLLSSVWGWCVWFFTLLAGAALLVLNTKLVHIVRYMTRGGHVHRLKPMIFWLNRPGLLLPVIKYLVFFNTFVFANSIFFATQFGRRSCFFSRTGFQGWVPISWWAVMLVNILYFLILCFVTLPMYSLAVHMGKELRQDTFPPELRERLQSARSQHKQVRGRHRYFLDLLKIPGPSRPKDIPVESTNGTQSEGGRQSSEQTHSIPLVSTPHSTAKGE